MKREFITESELAEMLSISKSTLHKLRVEGDIPYQIIGSSSCIRYKIVDIDAWILKKGHNQIEERI